MGVQVSDLLLCDPRCSTREEPAMSEPRPIWTAPKNLPRLHLAHVLLHLGWRSYP